MYPIYKSIGTKEKCKTVKIQFPPQEQNCQPGIEHIMMPRPISNTFINRVHMTPPLNNIYISINIIIKKTNIYFNIS